MWLSPQHFTCPSPVTAQVWLLPAAILLTVGAAGGATLSLGSPLMKSHVPTRPSRTASTPTATQTLGRLMPADHAGRDADEGPCACEAATMSFREGARLP